MPSADQALTESVRGLVGAACARNLSAEIHYVENGQFRRARMRLLSIDDEGIRVDMPQSMGKRVILRPGQQVSVYFMLHGEPRAFRTKVIRPIIVTDLNSRKRVKGAALFIPKRVSREQRRHDFRLQLAGGHVPADMHRVDCEQFESSSIDAERFVGRITNISGGGLALLLDVVVGVQFRVNERLYVLFELPDVAGRFVLPVEIRHLRKLHDDQNLSLGLQFQALRAPEHRAQLQRIGRFIADEQRRKLHGRNS